MSASLFASVAGWVVVLGLPTLVLVTRLARVRSSKLVALLQDASPIVLILAWPAAAVAAFERRWLLLGVAGATVAYHLSLLADLARRRHRPRWLAGSPEITVAVANVYVDNDQIEASAAQLVDVGADVVVVTETTPQFRAAFDAQGGAARYPYRAFDPDDDSDYAASLYTSIKPIAIGMADVGELRAALATIPAGSSQVEIVGVLPMAAVDRGGYPIWRRQVRALARYAARARHPLIVAGDLNTTTQRNEFADLRAAGLRDAHKSLGLGLRPSFKLAATGPLARLGPLVRLDHLLVNAGAWATDTTDLDPAGSDHLPFVARVAIRVGPRHDALAPSTRAGSRLIRPWRQRSHEDDPPSPCIARRSD